MKPFLFSVFFSVFAAVAIGQHNHFVYLQSDNKQPFYVRMGDKLYSSASSGYVIIPKLQQGTHSFNIGFPKNEWSQQTIAVEVNGKDQGFLLKNFDSKGWGLFNIQTMAVIMAGDAAKGAATQATVAKTDEFSNTLADVVNTPSIKQVKAEQPKEEKKSEPIAVKDSEPVAAELQPAAAPAIAVVNKEQPINSINSIKKINVAGDNVATVYKYQVSDEGGTDTVDVVILNEVTAPASTAKEAEKAVDTAAKKVVKEVETAVKKQSSEQEPKFIDIELPKADNKQSAKEEAVNAPRPVSAGQAQLKIPNSDCKSIATENDFLKARKKMTSQKSDDDMVEAARKLFKQKCYSTEQVKNLSVLFLKDEGKYKFFDAAYPFVHDSGEFGLLESQLSDEYYITRFRTMIRK